LSCGYEVPSSSAKDQADLHQHGWSFGSASVGRSMVLVVKALSRADACLQRDFQAAQLFDTYLSKK